jgi:hypothetical protein
MGGFYPGERAPGTFWIGDGSQRRSGRYGEVKIFLHYRDLNSDPFVVEPVVAKLISVTDEQKTKYY